MQGQAESNKEKEIYWKLLRPYILACGLVAELRPEKLWTVICMSWGRREGCQSRTVQTGMSFLPWRIIGDIQHVGVVWISQWCLKMKKEVQDKWDCHRYTSDDSLTACKIYTHPSISVPSCSVSTCRMVLRSYFSDFYCDLTTIRANSLSSLEYVFLKKASSGNASFNYCFWNISWSLNLGCFLMSS